MRTILLALCLSSLPALATDVYTFSLLGPETVSGPGGIPTITGWGYTIQNQSSSNWLVTTDLTAGTFLHATPQLLFDFPDLAPGATVTVPYNPAPPTAGLYQIVWDQNVPAGFVNAGTFMLSAQWWNGDPLNGGTLIGTAPSVTQPYSASPTVVPEPATASMVALFFVLFALGGLLRYRTPLMRPMPGQHVPGHLQDSGTFHQLKLGGGLCQRGSSTWVPQPAVFTRRDSSLGS